MVVPVLIGALKTVSRDMEKKLEKLEIRCNIMAEGFRFIYLAFRFS